MGQHDRRRLVGQGLLRRHRGRPERDRREGRSLQHAGRRRHLRGCCGLPVLDGSRSRRASGAPTPTRSRRAPSAPRTCRHLFRDDYVTNSNDSYWLSNPEEPLEGFARIIGDERTERALRTRLRPRHGRGATIANGKGFTAAEVAAARSSPTASTRASCGATSWSPICEANPTVTTTSRPGRRLRGLPGARRLGPARRPRLERRAAVSPLRVARCWRAPAESCRRRPCSRTPFDVDDPVHTPNGLNTANPNRRRRARRCGQRPRGVQHPARRTASRLSVRGPRHAKPDPDPRRPGQASASSTRSTCSWNGAPAARLQRRRPRLELRDGHGLRRGRLSQSTARSSPTRCRRTPTRPTTATRPSCSRRSSGSTSPGSSPRSRPTRSAPPSLNGGYAPPASAEPVCEDGGAEPTRSRWIGSPGGLHDRGNPGARQAQGHAAADVICAGDGKDRVRGAAAMTSSAAGRGRDRLSGNGGKDSIYGEDGRDVLRGGPGKDVLIGGPGGDECFQYAPLVLQLPSRSSSRRGHRAGGRIRGRSCLGVDMATPYAGTAKQAAGRIGGCAARAGHRGQLLGRWDPPRRSPCLQRKQGSHPGRSGVYRAERPRRPEAPQPSSMAAALVGGDGTLLCGSASAHPERPIKGSLLPPETIRPSSAISVESRRTARKADQRDRIVLATTSR